MSNNNDKKYYDILLEYLKGHDIIDLIDSNLTFSIQNDYNIILDLVKYDGYAIHCASNRLRGNKEIVLTAIRNYDSDDFSALDLASDELRGDKEVVLAAIQQHYFALEFASDRLRGDKEVVLIAVQKNGLALKFASKELQRDKELVLAAVHNNGIAFKYASEILKNDEEIVLAAVKQNGLIYNDIPNQLKNNNKVILAVVKQNGCALVFIIEYYRKHLHLIIDCKELVSIAVQQNIEALKYLPYVAKKIQNDKHFLIECYRNNKNSIQFNDFIKEFDKLENGIYNDDIFMKKNADILNLVNNNKEQFYDFLFKNNKYDIIYENEEISEYIRDNNKIVIFSINDIKPITDDNTVVVTEEEIKQKYSNNLFKINPKLTPIFIE